MILDLLIPPVKNAASNGSQLGLIRRKLPVDTDNDEMPDSDAELNERTRERFRKKFSRANSTIGK